jgi:pimeloyl-ACP methyl ester carboxylesterase
MVNSIDVKTILLANGLSLPFAETGDSAGIPVVFVHAYVESWRYFEIVLQHLPPALHGYAPTQRGHGDADRPDGYTPDEFASDVVGFMDAVGLQRAILVGSSSGGLVTQWLPAASPTGCPLWFSWVRLPPSPRNPVSSQCRRKWRSWTIPSTHLRRGVRTCHVPSIDNR